MAVVVEADFPLGAVGVPLAGGAHVVVFVVDDAGGAAGFLGDERGHHRGNAACVSLPPKPPPMRLQMQTTWWKCRPSASATTSWISVGFCVERVDDHLALLAGVGDARPAIRDRTAPGRRCGTRR